MHETIHPDYEPSATDREVRYKLDIPPSTFSAPGTWSLTPESVYAGLQMHADRPGEGRVRAGLGLGLGLGPMNQWT